MNLINTLFRFYLQASVHVALSVISLIIITSKFLNLAWDSAFLVFVFCSTIATYNFIKYGVEARKYFFVSNRYHRGIQYFSFANLLLAFFYLGNLTLTSWLTLLLTALFIGAYAFPVNPRLKNLRNYGILKIFLVALVWTLITMLLPAVQYQSGMGWDRYIDFTQRFLLILALMVPFEIRDLKYDLPELRTVPQRIGIKATKGVGIGLAVVCFLITFLKDDLHGLEIQSRALLTLVLVFFILGSKKGQSDLYASFWVEGLPIAWAGLLSFMDAGYT